MAKEMPIHMSNLALADPKTGKPTRVGYKFLNDGKKVRVRQALGRSHRWLKTRRPARKATRRADVQAAKPRRLQKTEPKAQAKPEAKGEAKAAKQAAVELAVRAERLCAATEEIL